MKKVALILIVTLSVSCHRKNILLNSGFLANPQPARPDYSKTENWASLPSKKDPADEIPRNSTIKEQEASTKADVFFIHPTIFTQPAQNQYRWNADVNDTLMNMKVDQSTILNQASVFNGSCKVYAPRYRQACLFAFFTPNKSDGTQALDLAYEDVKAAFEYYLTNFNKGRPIVIASHSQGTVHAKRLIKEFFDGKPLQKQLVAAYLIGIPTQTNTFQMIKPCESGDEIGCFVSWNTYAQGFYPKQRLEELKFAVSTNPLTWSLDENYAPKELNKGGVGPNFTMIPQVADAQNHQGMLWVNKPYVKGRFLLNTKVWHRADINLFYMNIRENVANRIDNFLEKN